MPLSQADRISFSEQILTSAARIAGINSAKAQLQTQISKLQALDTANANLFNPINTLINEYHAEFNLIDGNVRTSITEQDQVDSANRKFQNHFFPNDTATAVPSLVSLHNVWIRPQPFALTYAIGKNYVETYTVLTTYENELITTILGYTVFTPIPTVTTTVNDYITLLNSESTAILAINDPNPTNTANNTAAYNNIQTAILPALNAYLSGHVLSSLQTAVTARSTFLVARVSQLNAVLGSISQDVTTGNITASSGFYGVRYSYLSLRLNVYGGSLTNLSNFQAATVAQTDIAANIASTASTYFSILPTSGFKAPPNGTAMVHLLDVSFLSPGNTIYIMAENQLELQRAVKSISGNLVTLNDVVPPKYGVNVRLYKDLT